MGGKKNRGGKNNKPAASVAGSSNAATAPQQAATLTAPAQSKSNPAKEKGINVPKAIDNRGNLARGLQQKEEANALFGAKDFQGALSMYEQSLSHIRDSKERSKVLNNMALVHQKLGNKEQVITYCDQALEEDPQFVKALYRRGCGYMELGQFGRAAAEFQKALKLDPDQKDSTKQLENAKRELEKFRKTISAKSTTALSTGSATSTTANKVSKGKSISSNPEDRFTNVRSPSPTRSPAASQSASKKNSVARSPQRGSRSPVRVRTNVVKLKFTPEAEGQSKLQPHPLSVKATNSPTMPMSPIERQGHTGDIRSPRLTVLKSKLPSIATQKTAVKRLMDQAENQTMRVGDKWFIVAYTWWQKWMDFVGYENDQEDGAEGMDSLHGKSFRGTPPAIDNSHILGGKPTPNSASGYTLKTDIVQGHDFVLVPQEVWKALSDWYGGGPTIERSVVQVGDAQHRRLLVQLYPELEDEHESMDDEMQTVSSPAGVNEITVEDHSLHLAPVSTSGSIGAVSPTASQLARQSSLVKCGACGNHAPSSLCTGCRSIYYCNRQCQVSHWKYHKELCSELKDRETGDLSATAKRMRGKIGLNNLGNTCFMNSALQCLSHTMALTKHFLSNKYIEDLNKSNPLGTGGRLALEYDGLLKDLWFGSSRSVSPIGFKRAIARFAPQFAGYQQHDSHDLLTFLLDGLHEDLNRVKEKPYIEVKDVDDREDSVVAEEAWENHLKRNLSALVDIFHGQYKSTVICPSCDRVSVTFDPFSFICMELPRKHERIVNVTLYRTTPTTKSGVIPVRYAVPVDIRGRVGDLLTGLSRLSGIAREQVIMASIYNNTIYETFRERHPLSRIKEDDVLVAYEHPQPSVNTLPIVLLHRYPSANDDSLSLFGTPSFLSFPPNITLNQIKASIWQSIRHFVSLEEEFQGDEVAEAEEVLISKFSLSLVDENGLDLTNTEEEFTVSDIIKRLEVLPFAFISLDWVGPLQNYLDIDKMEHIINDHSVQQAQRVLRQGLTLDDCFQKFTSPEMLDKENSWYCSKCQEHRQATKKMELWKVPDVLILGLKRFEYRNAFFRDKLETLVDFPLDGLDLSEYVLSRQPSEEYIYDCYGVSNHYGKMGFGHYTAYARDLDNEENNGWYYFDDSSVTPASVNRIVSSAAYVLFYRRRKGKTGQVMKSPQSHL